MRKHKNLLSFFLFNQYKTLYSNTDSVIKILGDIDKNLLFDTNFNNFIINKFDEIDISVIILSI